MGAGWFGKTWFDATVYSTATATNSDVVNNRASPSDAGSADRLAVLARTDNPLPDNPGSTQPGVNGQSSFVSEDAVDPQNQAAQRALNRTIDAASTDTKQSAVSLIDSAAESFVTLLNEQRFFDAITLYQEQKSLNANIASRLRADLINHLTSLSRTQNNSDFSDLIEQYLSVYYDDVDFLLLLADFNQANGSYLEVVDVYLLATTYAYTEVDQQKVLDRFNNFTDIIDRLYTNQRNWWSLINFYSHISTSGMMSSTLQYRQALAHLRSGDQDFAVELLSQLLSDSVVGESAALALNNLDGHTSAPAVETSAVQTYDETIALQKIGNQYTINLTVNTTDNLNLLIDTGASMTAITSTAFTALGIGAAAVELERRVFRTAGGVVMGTVYRVAELQLGRFSLQDTRLAVLDFETNEQIDGLLGMNILGQFRFQIDQDNNQLLLSKK